MDKVTMPPFDIAYFGASSLRSLAFLLSDDDVVRTFVNLHHEHQVAIFDLFDSCLHEIHSALENVKVTWKTVNGLDGQWPIDDPNSESE
ncbi:Uncharacterised protein [Burkholderia pseudomallei]|nr:Uncharacterised protein [Burkholderia pseudomallei]